MCECTEDVKCKECKDKEEKEEKDKKEKKDKEITIIVENIEKEEKEKKDKEKKELKKEVENMANDQPLTAQEISQIISQNNDALMTKLSAMLAGAVSTEVTEERTYDIGEGEAWKANMKRMYDEYQHESLESIRRNRSYVDKTLSDAAQNDQFKQNVANQALQNAVETANMISKQAVRHGDIAIDRQWNVDEQAGFVAKVLNSIQDPAMATAMAVAIAEAMLNKKD